MIYLSTEEMMHNLCMHNLCKSAPKHSAALINWSGFSGFVEASRLSATNAWMGRLYSDSHDVGFILYNPNTLVEKIFTLVRIDKNPCSFEEDIAGWTFRSLDNKIDVFIAND